MIPSAIIKRAKADGVSIGVSASGNIKATGNEQAITRWLPVIREYKAEVLDALRHTPEELEILAWLESIDEDDAVVIGETMVKCRTSPRYLQGFLRLARGATAGTVQ